MYQPSNGVVYYAEYSTRHLSGWLLSYSPPVEGSPEVLVPADDGGTPAQGAPRGRRVQGRRRRRTDLLLW